MAALRAGFLALLLAVAAPAAGQDEVDRWAAQIAEASARFGVPEPWIRRVMRAESGGRTSYHGRPITSSAGAQGLMQVMPATWAEMRVAHGLGPDPFDPRDNILAGTAYLRAMYDRFGYPGLFAAYNAGPARYAEHLASGRALPSETIAYVSRVAGAGAAARQRPMVLASAQAAPSSLFAIRGPEQSASISPVSEEAPPGSAPLFFALRATPRP